MAILESKDPDGAKKGQYSGPRNRRASQDAITGICTNLQDQCARYDVVG